MIIPTIILILLSLLGGLAALLVGLVIWIILKLVKHELHLHITTNVDSKETGPSQE